MKPFDTCRAVERWGKLSRAMSLHWIQLCLLPVKYMCGQGHGHGGKCISPQLRENRLALTLYRRTAFRYSKIAVADGQLA